MNSIYYKTEKRFSLLAGLLDRTCQIQGFPNGLANKALMKINAAMFEEFILIKRSRNE